MFILELSKTYFQAVSLRLPTEDAKSKTVGFEAEFKRLSATEHTALMKRAKVEELSDADVAREIVVGWRQVRSASGDELPFSKEALERLLDVQGAGTAICAAYVASVSQAAGKN